MNASETAKRMGSGSEQPRCDKIGEKVKGGYRLGASPILSIIICCAEQSDDLDRTLDTIQRQDSLNQVEVVLVCPDDKVLRHGKERLKGVPVIASQDSGEGIYQAMNKGAGEAKGKWIYFVNSGDELLGNKTLEVMKVRMLKASEKCGLIAFAYSEESSSIAVQSVYFGLGSSELARMSLCHQAVLTLRDAAQTAGLFDLRWKFFADQDMFAKILRRGYTLEVDKRSIIKWQTEGFCRRNLDAFQEEQRLYRSAAFTRREKLIGLGLRVLKKTCLIDRR